jgi:hypothetical protein
MTNNAAYGVFLTGKLILFLSDAFYIHVGIVKLECFSLAIFSPFTSV